jgi:hypothetical protein
MSRECLTGYCLSDPLGRVVVRSTGRSTRLRISNLSLTFRVKCTDTGRVQEREVVAAP